MPAPAPKNREATSPTQRQGGHLSGSLQWDVSPQELLARLSQFRGDEPVRPYAVTTVRVPRNGTYLQQGSAPNFDGGLGTLCTCKHQMRSRYTVEAWASGAWVLGLTSLSKWRQGQQPYYYLMRVKQAFESQADLVEALRQQGRQDVLAAKDSTVHQRGDIFIPERPLSGSERFNPQNYLSPVANHVHSGDHDPLHWHNDIHYAKMKRQEPPVLVGDPEFTFVWSRPMVKRRHAIAIRDYEDWDLEDLRRDVVGVD